MTISQRLFALMSERGVSKAQLAKGTGINPRTVGDWEIKGTNPSADKIACICTFLDISTDWLLTGKERSGGSVHVSGSVSGGSVVQGVNHGMAIIRNGHERVLSDDVSEILRIAESLDMKRRHKLLDLAFTLEEEKRACSSTEQQPFTFS